VLLSVNQLTRIKRVLVKISAIQETLNLF